MNRPTRAELLAERPSLGARSWCGDIPLDPIDPHTADLAAMQRRIDTMESKLSRLRAAIRAHALRSAMGGHCIACAAVTVSDLQTVHDLIWEAP